MAKFDTESMLDQIKTILQTNLTTKLSDIDTEKGDGLTLDPIDDSGYFLNSVGEELVVSPFLIYGIQSVAAESVGATSSKAYSIFIAVGHSGLKHETDDTIQKKLMRYNRAIEEVMLEKFFSSVGGYGQITVEEFPANPEIHTKTGDTFQVAGLVFSATIA